MRQTLRLPEFTTLVAPRSAVAALTTPCPPPYLPPRSATAVTTPARRRPTATAAGGSGRLRPQWSRKKRKAPFVAAKKRRGRGWRRKETLRAFHAKRAVTAVRPDRSSGRGTSGGGDERQRYQKQH